MGKEHAERLALFVTDFTNVNPSVWADSDRADTKGDHHAIENDVIIF